MYRPHYHGHACPHIIVRMKYNSEYYYDNAWKNYPYIRILNFFPVNVAESVKYHTKNYTQCRTAHCKNDYLYTRYYLKSRYMCYIKCIRSYAHMCCKFWCNECRKYAWHKCGIIHYPNTHNFHWKYWRSYRSPKYCRKCRTHSTHNYYSSVFFIKSKQSSKLISNASAKLQCCSLSACRTSQKMRDNRRYKNERCHSERYFCFRMNCW